MGMTKDERQELLALYNELRVADVRDGMDWMMMHERGSMSPDIRPLWRTLAYGIARTARYVPYEGTVPIMSPEEYTKWCSWYHREICPSLWRKEIEDGDFIVIDASGVDAGLQGSNNSLEHIRRGVRGFVTNGAGRDTDEMILEKIPFWSKLISHKMTEGRLRYVEKDIPVNVGGVTVYPGDMVVADGDGVIVVPRKIARDVAKHARRQLEDDKRGRRKIYEAIGRELDNSVK